MASSRIGLLIFSLISIFSCQKGDEKLSHSVIENTLSGEWEIVSFHMPKYDTGRYYNGDWIYQDTLLKDVGSLYIPSFKAADLDLYEQNLIPLECTLIVDNETFVHKIEYFIPRENGVFVAFREHFINTTSETAKFVNTSNIFHQNVEIDFENKNRLIISKPYNPDDKYKIVLERK